MSVSDVKRGSISELTAVGVREVRAPSKTAAGPSDQSDDTVSTRPALFSQRSRLKLNSAIEATNVATQAVDDIGRFINGIEGIVEQAGSENLPPQRKEILEREAGELRNEILKAAQRSTGDGVRPLSGDKIRIEVEETLGKALEVILPDTAKDAFGLNDIQLGTKELIVRTVTSIEKARESIEALRSKLSEGQNAIERTVAAIEVARENLEASSVSIRDVNEALKVAHDTREGIRGAPGEAIGSIATLSDQAADLLR